MKLSYAFLFLSFLASFPSLAEIPDKQAALAKEFYEIAREYPEEITKEHPDGSEKGEWKRLAMRLKCGSTSDVLYFANGADGWGVILDSVNPADYSGTNYILSDHLLGFIYPENTEGDDQRDEISLGIGLSFSIESIASKVASGMGLDLKEQGDPDAPIEENSGAIHFDIFRTGRVIKTSDVMFYGGERFEHKRTSSECVIESVTH